MISQEFRFDLSAPKKGILAFTVTICADDKAGAVGKFVDYLTELKGKTFYPRPRHLSDSADSKLMGDELIWRLKGITDPMAYVVTLHLFTEHWLNRILLKFCPNHDLTDHRYSVKLEIAFALGKVTDDIFHNLTKLNALRNRVAHQLDFDLSQMDLNYRGSLPGFELKDYRPTFDPKGGPHHISNVLIGIMAQTYMLLHNHCVKDLGIGKPDTSSKTSKG